MLVAHLDLSSDWSYAGVAALGAFHGVNPAMGWLFAVAFGLQHGSRRALALAIVPLAIGHELSVLPGLLAVEELHLIASDTAIRIAGACALGAFGLWKLVRAHAHPRWVGMRLRYRELALWSFLMASAHGAGLMLLPFVVHREESSHTAAAIAGSGALEAVLAAAAHTAAMAAVAGAVALVVYEVVGVGVVRRAWLNLDRVWAVALLGGAAATLFIA